MAADPSKEPDRAPSGEERKLAGPVVGEPAGSPASRRQDPRSRAEVRHGAMNCSASS